MLTRFKNHSVQVDFSLWAVSTSVSS